MATDFQQRIASSNGVYKPVSINCCQVSSIEPSLTYNLSSRFGVLPVSFCDVGASSTNLAALTGKDGFALMVDYL